MAHWIDTIRGSRRASFGAPLRPGHAGRRFGGWRFGSVLETVVETIYAWQCRADERRSLMSMDDRMLKDIGVSRSQAEEEARKPFWTE